MNPFKRKVKLATTQEAFDAQAECFLVEYGFPLDDEYRALFGTFIQHSDDSVDTFCPSDVAKRIRKAQAIRCAFYLIHPSRRPKLEQQDGSEESGIQKASE